MAWAWVSSSMASGPVGVNISAPAAVIWTKPPAVMPHIAPPTAGTSGPILACGRSAISAHRRVPCRARFKVFMTAGRVKTPFLLSLAMKVAPESWLAAHSTQTPPSDAVKS